MALPSPSPFTLPLLSLTYINRQQRGFHASRAAATLGAHAVRPSSFGRGHSKNTYGGPFIPPAQNTNGGAPSLPYPTTQNNLRSPKPNYGQMIPKGQTWGCFLHPPLWAHGQVTPNPKKLGVAILGTPHFWHLGVTCPFLQFWTSEHQRNTWNTLTPTGTQPIARKPTYLGANLN